MLSVLPAGPLQGRRIVSLNWIADAEMADEAPVLWHIEDRRHAGGIEDRYPAHAKPIGARGKPQRVDGDGHRIVEGLRHGEPAEPVTLHRGMVGEHGDLAWRVVETGKLQPRIERGAVRRLHLQRVRVAILEALADGSTARGILSHDETPRLTQADRWCE